MFLQIKIKMNALNQIYRLQFYNINLGNNNYFKLKMNVRVRISQMSLMGKTVFWHSKVNKMI